MSFVVSFTDFTPIPRFDDIPWHNIKLEEATSQDGPFTQIDTYDLINLGGYDTDPAHPMARSFTSSNATHSNGWYRITFQDVNGGIGPVAPVQVTSVGEEDYLPTVTDVGLELLSRTRDRFGNLAGTFNGNTTPSDTQVMDIIIRVAPLVGDALGDEVPNALWDDAKKLIAIRAAMQVELSFFSDQVNTNRSVYQQLEKQYQIELERLQKQVTLLEETGSLSPADAGPALIPFFSFPDAGEDLMTKRF